MSPDPDAYGPVPTLWTPAEAFAAELSAWGPEHLAAMERQTDDLDPGDTPPLHLVVEHAPIWRREHQVPAGIVWIAGVTDHTWDPDGHITATVQVGVHIVAGGLEVGHLVHRYGAIVRAISFARPTMGGHCRRLKLIDEDYSPIDPQERGRALAGAVLSFDAIGVTLGRTPSGPLPGSVPREDPLPPWPVAPTVLYTLLDIDVITDPEEDD